MSLAKGREAESLISDAFNSYLDATNKQNLLPNYKADLTYSTELLNVTGDIVSDTQLVSAFNAFPAIRVLLHGPAGTGKTNFAHYISEVTGFDLKVVRASDILGAYVGESEKNVARIFAEAKRDKQMLLIDEVDSLLATRTALNQNWEVQLVNEFLTQIECFQQPLFATTNFFERLDKAVLRRFDYKVMLGQLTNQSLIDSLSQENQLKQPQAIIGFIQ